MLLQRRFVGRASRRAFTLMELLAVVAILAVLAGVAVPTYMYFADKAKLGTAKSTTKTLARLLDTYAVSHSEDFPQTEGYPDPGTAWSMLMQEGLLQAEPVDPWNKVFQWQLDSSSGRLKAVVFTTAPDGSIINSMQ